MKEKLRQCETRDREIILSGQNLQENNSQLTVSITSESPKSLQNENKIESQRPKVVANKKMTVGRERYYIREKRANLMKKVKELNSANYENFQISVDCKFYLKDKKGNYIEHEQSDTIAENEEIYKIF